MADDPSKPGYVTKYARRTLYGLVAFLGVLLGFIGYVGRLLNWW